MAATPRTVLITGCSDGSLGSALASALQSHGGFQLDVLSDASILSVVDQISSLSSGTLDILINSVGGGHYMPFLHLDLQEARALFDVNVWGFLATTQALLPLLMKSASVEPNGRKSIIVNNTSISSVLRTPYHSAYGASKAAMAAFNDAQRIELAPLGIRVVDLKTGSLESNFQQNNSNELSLPADSPYQPIEEDVMKVITGDVTEAYAEDRVEWAKSVVADLLKNPSDPPAQIWRGGKAGTIQFSSQLDGVIPTSAGDGQFQGLGGLDKLDKMLAEQESPSKTS